MIRLSIEKTAPSQVVNLPAASRMTKRGTALTDFRSAVGRGGRRGSRAGPRRDITSATDSEHGRRMHCHREYE